MNIAEGNIIASPAKYVNSGSAIRHQRVHRDDVAVQDIAPEIRARSRHVAHRAQRRQSVRVPAMCGIEWGQFLRSLELHRALV